ncbi:FAD/NAD(P)-binding domain-containing protein [Pseudovirgaria hyperparasitica]|uniref:FAD/NAD(P)-binding domain-containing protein n=1 Tax=Pseudovirgaria hyperparasitica TaxID=470096 RepID=A0A6A6WIX1_9PEZI|nr:FAD/NAD(P)-binding domain-containing protein [Pseudovirgaria hyperparasitica]KAF2762115.1 FAD/NAD(P)-binding domain-containing protein [Pseudovirgaria hyperparasitica]
MAARTHSSSQLDIIVVGAGLAGLAAAISCALHGHKVTILESAKELAEVGAGLQITPNASRLFQAWGVYDRLKQSAAEPTVLSVHRYSDGKLLAKDDQFNVHMRERYGAPFWDLHRVDVQRELARRANELGVAVKLGTRVSNIDFDAPRVTTESGAEYHCDMIVAADGLWSKCRECLLKKKDTPLPTGDLAYRILLPLDQIKDQDLRDMVSKPACRFWVGPKAHVVAYSIRDGTIYNIVLLVPDDLPEHVSKQQGSVDEMMKLFDGWDPVLTRFLKCVTTVDKWKLMHRDEMDSWVNAQSNFVMIGDSCHPMLPYLAQGANSAMEDGAVLGRLLGSLEHRSDLPKLLEIFQRLRKSRGEAIVRETFKQRRDFHMENGPEQEARDELFLSQLGKELTGAFPSRWTCPEVQPWIYGYRAEEEVDAALAAVRVLDQSDTSKEEELQAAAKGFTTIEAIRSH